MQRLFRKDKERTTTWVIALFIIVVLIIFLMVEAIIWATDDPVTVEERLLQAMLLILFVAPLAAQLLDPRKHLPRGPRQLAEQLRMPVVFLALLIAMRQPDATMSVGDTLRDWALFLVIIGLVNGYDLVSRLSDLRHKRRALRIISRNIIQVVVLVVVLSGALSLTHGQTAAQWLWVGIVILAVLVSDPFLSRIKIASRWRQGKVALFAARTVTITTFFAVVFVILGVLRDPSDMLAAVIGGLIGVASGLAIQGSFRSRHTL